MQLDEWRVWVTPRTIEQIRENMFKRLTGREPGLAALWNFDDLQKPGRDASPHGFDGTPDRDAQFVAGTLPNAIQGIVTDKDGRAVVNAQIALERDRHSACALPPRPRTISAAICCGAQR